MSCSVCACVSRAEPSWDQRVDIGNPRSGVVAWSRRPPTVRVDRGRGTRRYRIEDQARKAEVPPVPVGTFRP
jgi:hypothetical protein